MSVAALVPAAGAGTRLGLGPKAFLRVGGATLLEHAADLLAPFADELAFAVPAGREADARALLGDERVDPGDPGRRVPIAITVGGARRQETVDRLLDVTRAEWVLVHDAARPFTPASVVAAVVDATRRVGAATAGLPVADTLHDVQRDVPVARDALRAVQTPQGFARTTLREAHRAARAASLEATDDAQLVRRLGLEVAWVQGSPWSHKLTGPADLPWLEALARARADEARADAAVRDAAGNDASPGDATTARTGR